MIVFHGDRDFTVPPVNGDRVAGQWIATDDLADDGRDDGSVPVTPSSTAHRRPARWTRIRGRLYADRAGAPLIEHWVAWGMGQQAWAAARKSPSPIPMGRTRPPRAGPSSGAPQAMRRPAGARPDVPAVEAGAGSISTPRVGCTGGRIACPAPRRSVSTRPVGCPGGREDSSPRQQGVASPRSPASLGRRRRLTMAARSHLAPRRSRRRDPGPLSGAAAPCDQAWPIAGSAATLLRAPARRPRPG